MPARHFPKRARRGIWRCDLRRSARTMCCLGRRRSTGQILLRTRATIRHGESDQAALLQSPTTVLESARRESGSAVAPAQVLFGTAYARTCSAVHGTGTTRGSLSDLGDANANTAHAQRESWWQNRVMRTCQAVMRRLSRPLLPSPIANVQANCAVCALSANFLAHNAASPR